MSACASVKAFVVVSIPVFDPLSVVDPESEFDVSLLSVLEPESEDELSGLAIGKKLRPSLCPLLI